MVYNVSDNNSCSFFAVVKYGTGSVVLVPAFSSLVLSKHKCSLLFFLHTRIVCMSVKTSLLFYFFSLFD